MVRRKCRPTIKYRVLVTCKCSLFDLENLNEMPSTGVKYIEHEVPRCNTWIYLTGNEVYELTSEEGERYIMQSYSRVIDADFDRIMNIERMALPGDGLSHSNTPEDYYLVSDGKLESSRLKIVVSLHRGYTSSKTSTKVAWSVVGWNRLWHRCFGQSPT